MTPARLARWSFYAGAVLALAWATLWDVLDWPLWLAGLTFTAASYGAYCLIDRLAERTAARRRPRPHLDAVKAQRDLAVDQRNDARRVLEEARLEAAALLHHTRQHPDEPIDLKPLLGALQMTNQEAS